MDFQRRIQEAKRFVDQTKANLDRARGEARAAQADYNKSISVAPKYQNYYDKYKQEFTQSEEISELKSTWQKSKEAVDDIRTSIDKLPESIGQSFGGTSLTQAQRDMARKQQLQQLNESFMQYNANYEAQFADYNKRVDQAFDRALDVANKDYDSYWDGVRRKFSLWQTSIDNEKKWSEMAYKSRSQLSEVENSYRAWRIQQDIIRMERDFEIWQNNFAAQQRAETARAAKAAADRQESAIRREREANRRHATDTVLFQQGRMSAKEYLRRVDAGLYRT
ncbi:hypothetical protein CQ476_39 [TM7 phage DolZOral124_53_65]|nr:hypothetical protein CQ476_39 [TM7 phage DolZOral124_53_65]